MVATTVAISALLGYLLGSIPFGLLLTRMAGAGDLRAIGSGNIGATNVLRTGRKGLAAGTLALDALKGFLAVVLAAVLFSNDTALVATASDAISLDPARGTGVYAAGAAAVGAMLGHCFPVWLGFKGGKGVATFLGAILGLFPPGAVAFAAVWLSTAYLSRYSSLSALVAVAVVPLFALVMGETFHALVIAAMGLLVFYRHGENIQRLRAGTERRIGGAA